MFQKCFSIFLNKNNIDLRLSDVRLGVPTKVN